MNRGWRSIVFPFYGDLDQSTEKKITATSMGGGVSGMFDRMVNLRIDKTGRIVKRYGHEVISKSSLGGLTIIGRIHRIHGLADELISVDDANVWTAMASDDDLFASIGRSAYATIARKPAVRGLSGNVHSVDMDEVSGLRCIAWFEGDPTTGGTVYATVIDVETGAVVLQPSHVTNAPSVRVSVFGGRIFYSKVGDTKITYRDWSATGFDQAVDMIINRSSTRFQYDLCRFGADHFAIAYFDDSGNVVVQKRSLSNPSQVPADYDTPVSDPFNIALLGDASDEDGVWLAHADGDGVCVTYLDDELSADLAETVIDATATEPEALGIAYSSTSRVNVFWQLSTAATAQNWTGTVECRSILSLGSMLAKRTWDGMALFSRPWTYDGTQNCLIARLSVSGLGDAYNTDCAALLRTTLAGSPSSLEQPDPLAFFARANGLSTTHHNATLSRFVVAESNGDKTATKVRIPMVFSPPGGTGDSEIDIIEIDHADDTANLCVEHSGCLYMSGSLTGGVHSQGGLVELGFPFAVPLSTTSAPYTRSASGGSIKQGVYQYVFIPEWLDGSGRRHQGPPSPVIEVDMSSATYVGNTNSVSWTVPNLKYTRKENIRLVPYRTKKGPGSVFYRVTGGEDGSSNALEYVTNDPTGSAQTWVDVDDDDTIAINETLYASAGEQIHEVAPPSKFITVHDTRLVGIDSEYPGRIWLTHPSIPFEGPAYSSVNQIVVGDRVLTALASMDGKLYAFTDSEIFLAMYGPGPERNGSGAPFPTPQLLTTQAGCSEVRSLIVGPDGIYFAGPAHPGVAIFKWMRGDTGLVTLSDKVRDDLDEYPVITSATHVRDQSQIRWTCRNTDGDDGRVLVYDYSRPDANGVGAWSVYKLTDSSGVAMFQTATTWNGQWTAARSDVDGELWLEETDRRDDDGQFVGTELRTAYLWPAGPMSPCYVKSITVMGEYLGPCVLNITLENGPDTDEQTSFTLSGTAGDDVFKQWQIRQRKRGRGYVRWTFTETVSGSSVDSAGVALNAIQMQWTPLSGPLRLGAGGRS